MSVWFALVLALAAAQSQANFFQLSPEQFSATREAKEEIRFEAVNSGLLSAAVLHETNRRRVAEGLPPLKHHAKAIEAAEIQSQIMKKRGSISHENPENPKYATLIKRVQAVGVKPGFAAENVATSFGFRYQSGRAFYKREERGKTIFSYTPEGPAMKPHTYESFARALVESWMNSPGHRKNILHESAEYLGASCVVSLAKSEMPIFYCTQVFLAPLKRQ
jgi:uncharacterized protein YkwD